MSASSMPPAPHQSQAGAPQRPKRMQTTRYDRVSAALVAALVLTVTLVSMLFIVWYSTRIWTKPLAVEPQLIEPLAGGGDALGDARELVEPGEEELEDFEEPELQQTFDTLTDALSSQPASLDALGGSSASSNRGAGAGDSRQPGPGDGDANPRSERWQIHFASSSIDGYARQLDFFGIELAAAGGDSSTIDYVSDFTGQVVRRQGTPSDEERMYLTWKYGPLRKMDIALLRKAGVKTHGRFLMQFLPPKTENLLANVEMRYCEQEGRRIPQIRKTIFKVKKVPAGFEFYVDSQTTR